MSQDLAAFLSMEVKMPIASLLKENPTLSHDLSDWMNGHLDSMMEVHEENWTKEESNSQKGLIRRKKGLGQFWG